MEKRHAPKYKGKPFECNSSIDSMLRKEELGRKEIHLSKAMIRPAYAYTKIEQKKVIKPLICEGCGYYYQAEEMPKPDCTFPWFDPEDYDLAAYDYLPCKEGLTYEED